VAFESKESIPPKLSSVSGRQITQIDIFPLDIVISNSVRYDGDCRLSNRVIAALDRKTMQNPTGIVYLVGAGPGDPGLITVRGAELLAAADVVVYDYLSNPELLAHAPGAEAIYVGKKAASHSMTQDQINELLVGQAQAGKKVVRLKGGDPFVFGRGGEECLALQDAGIPFEVVPGVTAAIAAPAYAGIPVTHRDYNSSFTFITGHEKEEEYKESESRMRIAGSGSDLDWAVLAKLPCLAFYMGVKSLPRICSKLIEHGMDPATPAATIRWGTMTKQQTVIGTIADLPDKVATAKLAPPAMTIIGRVVSLRPELNWFESKPLFGKTIVVTRTRQQASELSTQLQSLGARIIEAPTIDLKPADPATVEAALADLHGYDWIVFTSANGVRFTRDRLIAAGRDSRAFGPAKIATIGDATAAAVRKELCLNVDLSPERFVAEALGEAFAQRNEITGKRFLLLRADIARPLLRERLQQGGAAEVRDVPIYETHPTDSLPQELIDAITAGEVDWLTFTSSSTVNNFIQLLGPALRPRLTQVRTASIGPITSQTLRQHGLEPTIEARTFDIPGLVAAMRKY
jgi:uroporphyrinogen III methyltransferase/synthase